MSDNDAIYSDARNLASRLLSEGDGESAKKISEAIDFGSTGSEILMALQFISNHLRDDAQSSDAVRSEADQLYSKLTKALEA